MLIIIINTHLGKTYINRQSIIYQCFNYKFSQQHIDIAVECYIYNINYMFLRRFYKLNCTVECCYFSLFQKVFCLNLYLHKIL